MLSNGSLQMSQLEHFLSKCHCLISQISDWRLQGRHAWLKKPSCHCARWSRYGILWTRQTEKLDGNICTRQLHIRSVPLLPHCQRPPVIKAVTRKGGTSNEGAFSPSPCSCACNEAWHGRRTETKQGSPVSERGHWSLTLCVFNNG